MLFTGEYEHSIDAKQRMAVPKEIRAGLDSAKDGSAFYIVPGPNGAPWLWPERTFETLSAATGSALLPSEDKLEFEQYFYSQARRLDIDSVGRIRIPERTIDDYGLGSKVVIIGVKDHLELHDAATWSAERERRQARQAEIMLRARRDMEAAQRKDDA